jgi:hypothetical protein
VKSRAGAATPAGLDHEPDLTSDDAEQEQPGHGIAKQQFDHDLVDRRDRGQAGQHQEGGGRREERDADRTRPDPAGRDRNRRGRKGVERCDLIDSRHVTLL